MTITVDEKVLSAKLNAAVDIPYLPESVEKQAFDAGVAAAVEAIVRISSGSESLAEYGVRVTA